MTLGENFGMRNFDDVLQFFCCKFGSQCICFIRTWKWTMGGGGQTALSVVKPNLFKTGGEIIGQSTRPYYTFVKLLCSPEFKIWLVLVLALPIWLHLQHSSLQNRFMSQRNFWKRYQVKRAAHCSVLTAVASGSTGQQVTFSSKFSRGRPGGMKGCQWKNKEVGSALLFFFIWQKRYYQWIIFPIYSVNVTQ